MKTRHIVQIIACLFGMCCLTGLTGCASMDSSSKESLLTAAGFRIKTPRTPAQLQAFAEAPSYKLHRATVEGRTFYVYKDEKGGVAYVGGEEEYQKFQQLSLEKQIAQDNRLAAQMNQQVAMNWYRGWGYSGWNRRGAFWW